MPRHEFTKKTKREALLRSGGKCEAIGEVYGLSAAERCYSFLSYGVEFDHYPEPAGVKGSNALDNCMSVCKLCHRHKTRTFDIPMQAKDKRIRDKHSGVAGPKGMIQSRGFGSYQSNAIDINGDRE